MNKQLVTRKEVVWSRANDRYVYIVRDQEGTIVELNFMQGGDETSYEECQEECLELMKLYNTVKGLEPYARIQDEFHRVNEVMWLYGSLMMEGMLIWRPGNYTTV